MKYLIFLLCLCLINTGRAQIKGDPSGNTPVFFYDNAELKAKAAWGMSIKDGYNYFSGGDHNPANENQTGSVKVVSMPDGIKPRSGIGAYEHRVKYVAPQYGGSVPDLSYTRSEWYMFGGGQAYIPWQWAAMSLMLPKDFHYDANRMSVGFDCKFSDATGPASFILFIENGNFVLYWQDPRYRKDEKFIIGPATRGQWIDFALNRDFTTGSEGFINFYMNGKLVFSRRGPNYDVNKSGYILMGIYKWPWANTSWQNEPASTSTKDIVIYTDEIKFGTAAATLAGMSPSGAGLPIPPTPVPPTPAPTTDTTFTTIAGSATDKYFSGGTSYTVGGATERFGTFSYNIPLKNGTYTVNLGFAEIFFTAAAKRTFNVLAEGKSVLSNYDVFLKAGAMNKTVTESLDATITDGILNLNFNSVKDYAKVSTISVTPKRITLPPVIPPPVDTKKRYKSQRVIKQNVVIGSGTNTLTIAIDAIEITWSDNSVTIFTEKP